MFLKKLKAILPRRNKHYFEMYQNCWYIAAGASSYIRDTTGGFTTWEKVVHWEKTNSTVQVEQCNNISRQ